MILTTLSWEKNTGPVIEVSAFCPSNSNIRSSRKIRKSQPSYLNSYTADDNVVSLSSSIASLLLQRQQHRHRPQQRSSLPTMFSNAASSEQDHDTISAVTVAAAASGGGDKESSKDKRKAVGNKSRGNNSNKNKNSSKKKKNINRQKGRQQQNPAKQLSRSKGRSLASLSSIVTTSRMKPKKFDTVSELVQEVRKVLTTSSTTTNPSNNRQQRRGTPPKSGRNWKTAWSTLQHAATIPYDERSIVADDNISSSNNIKIENDKDDMESILSTTAELIASASSDNKDGNNSAATTTTQITVLPVRVYHEVLECIKKQKTHNSWQDAIRVIEYMEKGKTAVDDKNEKISGSNNDGEIWYLPPPNYEIYHTVVECACNGGRKGSDDASVYWLSKMLRKFEYDVERQNETKDELNESILASVASHDNNDYISNKNKRTNTSTIITNRDRKLVRNSIQLVLTNLSRQRKWREALRLLDYTETNSDEIPITVVQYNTVLGCLAKSKQIGQCQRLLYRLQQKSKEQLQKQQLQARSSSSNDNDDTTRTDTTTSIIRPDEISYNAVIGACASMGWWKDALKLVEDCSNEPNLKPNIYIYTNAMRACAKAGQTQRALGLLQKVKDEGLPVDSYCYTAVIDACSKGKQWKKALDLFDEMEEKGIIPTQVTYSVTISALGNGLQWERALLLLSVMRDKGMQVNLYTYNAAITALAKSSKNKHSAMLSSSSPTLEVKQRSIDSQQDLGQEEDQHLWPKALDLLDQMIQDGIEPDGFCYSSAINCCGAEGRWKEACQLIDKMKRGSPKNRPNKIAYTACISACGRAGQASKALELFQDMKDDGIPADRVAYNALFSALRVSEDADKAYELWGEICGKRSLTTSIASTIATARDIASPDIITLTDCIATLSRAGYKYKMDEVFRQAVEREGIVLQSNDSLDSIWEIDLSGMPFPIARAACRYLLRTITDEYQKKSADFALEDMVFITGVGVNHQKLKQGDKYSLKNITTTHTTSDMATNNVLDKKDRTTSLRDFIQGILESDFDSPIKSTVPSRAQGTVVIEKDILTSWLLE